MINKGLIVSFDDAEAAGQVSVRTTENPETVLISHGENRFPVKLSDLKEALAEIDGFNWVKKTMDSIPTPPANLGSQSAVDPPTYICAPFVIPLGPSTNIGSTSTGFTTTITNVTNVPPTDSL
jgi:hypothetical protein